MVFALVGLLLRGVSVIHRAFAMVVGVMASALLVRTQSATSLATVVPVLALVAGLFGAGRVAPGPRLVVLLFGVLTLAVLAVVALQGDAEESILAAFGKDATLTGRTLLWSEGLAAAAERPWFGSGYNAFWRIGHPPAEYLWELFYITARSGFHFHNTYIQTAVGVGLVGLALLLATMVAGLALAVRAALRPRVTADAVIATALIVLLLMRSFVEIDILYPYTVGVFLFNVALLRLASPQAAVVQAPAPRPVRFGYGERRIVLSARHKGRCRAA